MNPALCADKISSSTKASTLFVVFLLIKLRPSQLDPTHVVQHTWQDGTNTRHRCDVREKTSGDGRIWRCT